MQEQSPFPPPDPLRRLMYRYWPSQRLGMDPLAGHSVDGRYFPVTIANWKLIPPVACLLLARRIAHPLGFESGRRLTIVIPFRDREAHLEQLLPPLIAMLASQQAEARILVVEQEAGRPFNRGKLINVGFAHAADASDYFCIHDVDAIPVKANYLCPSQPVRLVNHLLSTQRPAAVCPQHYFSGAISILKSQVQAVNGFSNEYWGWGKEDDEFLFRLQLAGYLCYYDAEGAYHDLPNPQAQLPASPASPSGYTKANRARRSLMVRGLKSPGEDGLSTLEYKLLAVEDRGRYERIRVAI